jgi:hypothetical protein
MNMLSSQYTLEMTLNTNADGSITITLPRNMIDAIQNNVDVQFVVGVNGNQVTQFSETKNQYSRILSIPFHNGDSKIDITGTQVNVGSTSSSVTPQQFLLITGTGILVVAIVIGIGFMIFRHLREKGN